MADLAACPGVLKPLESVGEVIELPANQEVLLERIHEFDAFLTERDITQYHRMADKDPQILQLWGTNYRRRFSGNDYWVKATLNRIRFLAQNWDMEKWKLDDQHWVFIADTRFKNEAQALREHGGVYVDVIRLHDNGTRFIAPDRDPKHPSEADLDGFTADYRIAAHNMVELALETERLYRQIRRRNRRRFLKDAVLSEKEEAE